MLKKFHELFKLVKLQSSGQEEWGVMDWKAIRVYERHL